MTKCLLSFLAELYSNYSGNLQVVDLNLKYCRVYREGCFLMESFLGPGAVVKIPLTHTSKQG